MTTYSRTSFDQAVELAQLAKPWDTAPAEQVAALLSEAHAEALFADAWSTGSTFALMDALNAIQRPSKVSLVKSAPATYCSGSVSHIHYIHRNDLTLLHLLMSFQSPKVSLVKSYVGTLGYLQHIGHDLSSFEY